MSKSREWRSSYKATIFYFDHFANDVKYFTCMLTTDMGTCDVGWFSNSSLCNVKVHIVLYPGMVACASSTLLYNHINQNALVLDDRASLNFSAPQTTVKKRIRKFSTQMEMHDGASPFPLKHLRLSTSYENSQLLQTTIFSSKLVLHNQFSFLREAKIFETLVSLHKNTQIQCNSWR